MQSYKWSAALASATPRIGLPGSCSCRGFLVDQYARRGIVYGETALRALVARPIAQMRRLDSHRRTRAREMYFMDGYTIYRVHRVSPNVISGWESHDGFRVSVFPRSRLIPETKYLTGVELEI